MSGRRIAVLTAFALATGSVAAPASAHGFRPTLAWLREETSGAVDVVWQPGHEPGSPGADIRFEWPARCSIPWSGDAVDARAADGERHFRLECGPRGLHGARLGVTFPQGPGHEVMVHWIPREGPRTSALLRPDQPTLSLPERGERVSAQHTAVTFTRLGVDHILSGADHLGFVLGLVLLARAWRAGLAALTAFTLGHSVTLVLAALDVVRVPAPPVEALIAFSVMVLASACLTDRDRTTSGSLARMAAGMGLLHGLGFATALAETGLPAQHRTLALAMFNVGVELGQVAFAFTVAAPAAWLFTRMRETGVVRVREGTAWALGIAAAVAFVSRLGPLGT